MRTTSKMVVGNMRNLENLLTRFMPHFALPCGISTSPLTRSVSCLSRCNLSLVNNDLQPSNKSLTRENSSADHTDDTNGIELRSAFVNRNPRNEEYLGYNKPRGYSTQFTRRDFYNRLRLIISNRHTKATVNHNSGAALAQASTTEFIITKYLYKTTDISAARNVGRVLAQRCRLAGLTRLAWEPEWGDKTKLRVKAFVKAMERGGIQLSEPRRVIPIESFYTDFRPKKNIRKWKKMPYSVKRKR